MHLWSCQEILNILGDIAKQVQLHFVENLAKICPN